MSRNEKFRRPIIPFIDLLAKGAAGLFSEKGRYSPFMFRALVLAVDPDGGKIETPTGKPHKLSGKEWVEGGEEMSVTIEAPNGIQIAQYSITPTRGPVNPPKSVRARIIGNNTDKPIPDDDLRCYWPMFAEPPVLPTAGELVYVVFEEDNLSHGLWLNKVTTNLPAETSNQILLTEAIKLRSENGKTFVDGSATDRWGTGRLSKDPFRLTKLFFDVKSAKSGK